MAIMTLHHRSWLARIILHSSGRTTFQTVFMFDWVKKTDTVNINVTSTYRFLQDSGEAKRKFGVQHWEAAIYPTRKVSHLVNGV